MKNSKTNQKRAHMFVSFTIDNDPVGCYDVMMHAQLLVAATRRRAAFLTVRSCRLLFAVVLERVYR